MTELLSPRLETDTFAHPLTGESLDVRRYLLACITTLAEPMPEPGYPTSRQCAVPLVERLMDMPTDTLRLEKSILFANYLPASEDPKPEDPSREWVMTKRLASRYLISEIVSSTYLWARGRDDRERAAAMTSLACDLLERELLGVGDPGDQVHAADIAHHPRAINPTLLGVVQASAERHVAEAVLATEASDAEATADWIRMDDINRVRDVLAAAYMADKLDLFRNESAMLIFLLETYGFSPEDIKQLYGAWRIGFVADDTETGRRSITERNVRRMIEVEFERPGSSRLLFDTHGKRCFARRSVEYLRYLADLPIGAANSVDHVTAIYDPDLGSFDDPEAFDELWRQGRKNGVEVQEFEVGSALELEAHIDGLEERDVLYVSISSHGGDGELCLGNPVVPGSIYKATRIEANGPRIAKACHKLRGLAVISCGSGGVAGIAQAFSYVLQNDQPVAGLRRVGGVDVGYEASEGFVLHKSKEFKKATPINPRLIRLASFGVLPLVVTYRNYEFRTDQSRWMEARKWAWASQV